MKSVAICMAHWNRLPLLLNTLKSIEAGTQPTEIIIIDDASPEPLKPSDFEGINLPIKFINIPAADKTWVNCCVPYNYAFSQVSSDITIIQNPECIHDGDIVGDVLANLTDENYLTYACYSLPPNGDRTIIDRIPPQLGAAGWYNHPIYEPRFFHFCSAITTKNLRELNGFDLRYAQGRGYDDDEFVYRVRKKGLNMQIVEYPKVFHQYHYSSNTWNHVGWTKNAFIYHEITLKGL